METLLEKVLNKVSELPEEEKESFAAFILEELEQEKKWQVLFKKSSSELNILANEALKEYKAGEVEKLDPEKL